LEYISKKIIQKISTTFKLTARGISAPVLDPLIPRLKFLGGSVADPEQFIPDQTSEKFCIRLPINNTVK
jgi:hypothetical protein